MLGLSNGLSSSLNTHWTPMQQHLDTGEDETVDLVVNHFTTFWHVPVVNKTNEEQHSPVNESDHWKVVGSPPRRSFVRTSSWTGPSTTTRPQGSDDDFNQVFMFEHENRPSTMSSSSSLLSNSIQSSAFFSSSLPTPSILSSLSSSSHQNSQNHLHNNPNLSTSASSTSSMFSSSPRGWNEVVSQSKPIQVPKSNDHGYHQSWQTSSSPSSPAYMQFSDQSLSPRKDSFSGSLRNSHSDYEFPGDLGIDTKKDDTFAKRRPSFQKSLAKEKSKPLDPSFGLENKYFRVEFKSGRGGVYYIDREKDKKYDMKVGDFVIVEADRGKDLGKIIVDERPDKDAKVIYRLAKSTEIAELLTKTNDEAKSLALCQSKIKQKKLPMEVVEAEYQWDREKLTYYFIADRRIDFRELVRELFKVYKTRIWMCSVEESRANELKQNLLNGIPSTAANDAANYAAIIAANRYDENFGDDDNEDENHHEDNVDDKYDFDEDYP